MKKGYVISDTFYEKENLKLLYFGNRDFIHSTSIPNQNSLVVTTKNFTYFIYESYDLRYPCTINKIIYDVSTTKISAFIFESNNIEKYFHIYTYVEAINLREIWIIILKEYIQVERNNKIKNILINNE